jgi:hypothetical protein
MSALNVAMNPGPNRNDQSRTATRPWLTAVTAAGSPPGGTNDVLQGDDGEEGTDPHHDDGGLDESGGDVPDGECLALPFDDGVEGDRGANTGHGGDPVADSCPEQLSLVAGDEAQVVVDRRTDEHPGRDGRREGQDVEEATGQGVSAGRVFHGRLAAPRLGRMVVDMACLLGLVVAGVLRCESGSAGG